jgi:predicted O-methyltransferase YrrM
MSLRTKLAHAVSHASHIGFDATRRESQQLRDLEQSMNWLLQEAQSGNINDIVGYISLLRECIEPMKCNCEYVKDTDGGIASDTENKFKAFVSSLQERLAPTRPAMAIRIAKIADEYRSPRFCVAFGSRLPISLHFTIASSAGRKGRLLAAAVKFFQPNRIVELGTAYGISSLFMGLALEEFQVGKNARVIHTLEGFEPQASLCREVLQRELGSLVQCVHGRTNNALPEMAKSAGEIDFVFHDAGHSYDDYIHDFDMLLPHMRPGSILLLDDIRWDDPRYTDKPARTYDGWLAVVSHPRVRIAVEIDAALGAALIL